MLHYRRAHRVCADESFGIDEEMLAAAVNFDDDHESWEAPRATPRVNTIAPAAAKAVESRPVHTYVRPFVRCAALAECGLVVCAAIVAEHCKGACSSSPRYSPTTMTLRGGAEATLSGAKTCARYTVWGLKGATRRLTLALLRPTAGAQDRVWS